MVNQFKLTKLQKAFIEVIRSFPDKRLTMTTTWFDPTASNCVGAPHDDVLDPDNDKLFYAVTLPVWFEDRFRFVLSFRTSKPYDAYEKTIELLYTPKMISLECDSEPAFSETFVMNIHDITDDDVVLSHRFSVEEIHYKKSKKITVDWVLQNQEGEVVESVDPFPVNTYAEVIKSLWRFVSGYVPQDFSAPTP